MKCAKIIAVLILLAASVHCKVKKSIKQENDVLEKSEVVLKFPTYALKMPPIITSRKHTNSLVDPVPVSCTSNNVTKSLNDLRKKIKCVPRDTVVQVSAPDGAKVVPNTVVVKRCGGMCSGGKKCLPSKKTNVDFYVRTTQQKSSMVFCNKISVAEDTECKCGCLERKKCSADQKFDSALCKCVCTNKDDETECLNKIAQGDGNFKWISKTCSCGCKTKKICTTDTVWMHDECRCVRQ